jgi:hypothetical protein
MKFRVQRKVMPVLMLTAVLLGSLWAQTMGPPPDAIQSVSPAYAVQGDTNVQVTVTLASRFAPPYEIKPQSMKIGAVQGRNLTRNGLTVTAAFDFPGTASTGHKTVSIEFPGPPNRGGMNVVFTRSSVFEIRASSSQVPGPNPPPLPDPGTSSYILAGTGQDACYDNFSGIICPGPGEGFYGQDANFQANPPSYWDNGDGTITDLNTGLMWQKDPGEKKTWYEAMSGASTCQLGGYNDWRLPGIKELYSLILFSGIDPSGPIEPGGAGNVPFLDTNYFIFQYGDVSAGERIIDAQYWSSTEYVGTTMDGAATVFGVNFADGRIKGYPRDIGANGLPHTQFVRYVRGNSYGGNIFIDNQDGTITDQATGLMWSKADSGSGLNWQQALAWVQRKNLENYLGYNDWRLPNAKELQSIVDYTRSPATTNSAAIDPVFQCTPIIDEGGETNYAFYWTGTTHINGGVYPGTMAVYIAFGEALGYMEMPPNPGIRVLMDVHGAGAQRSDPKVGDPAEWPEGHGPQGDVRRIYNFVRLVRGVPLAAGSSR